ncbi:MAG: LolA family protein [Gemmatimonadota bacterium]
MRRTAAILLAAILSAWPVASRGADEVLDLLKKSVNAYGGEKALSKLVFSETGKLSTTMRGEREGTITRIYQRPDKLRVEVSFPGQTPEVRVLDGRKGWRQGEEASGMPFDAMVLQAARFALPLNLLERRSEVKDLGTVTLDGKELRVLELPLGGTLSVTAEIDPATGRIMRSAAKTGGGMGGMSMSMGGMPGVIEFATTYADFRKVDGILFAFREGNFAMGQHTGDTHLEKIEVLQELPPGALTP